MELYRHLDPEAPLVLRKLELECLKEDKVTASIRLRRLIADPAQAFDDAADVINAAREAICQPQITEIGCSWSDTPVECHFGDLPENLPVRLMNCTMDGIRFQQSKAGPYLHFTLTTEFAGDDGDAIVWLARRLQKQVFLTIGEQQGDLDLGKQKK